MSSRRTDTEDAPLAAAPAELGVVGKAEDANAAVGSGAVDADAVGTAQPARGSPPRSAKTDARRVLLVLVSRCSCKGVRAIAAVLALRHRCWFLSAPPRLMAALFAGASDAEAGDTIRAPKPLPPPRLRANRSSDRRRVREPGAPTLTARLVGTGRGRAGVCLGLGVPPKVAGLAWRPRRSWSRCRRLPTSTAARP